MKRMIIASMSDRFNRWYDELPSRVQEELDDYADEEGYPMYDECSDAELSSLMDYGVNLASVTTSSKVRRSFVVQASSKVEPKSRIEPGLIWHRDGFIDRVTWVSDDHKKCTITENWISEDTGKEKTEVDKYNIAVDDNGNEFAYLPKYKEYAFNASEPDGYSWWARMYAVGADNYRDVAEPDKNESASNDYTFAQAIWHCQEEVEQGEIYDKVVVKINGDVAYNGNSLDEAYRHLNYYSDVLVDKFTWIDEVITIVISDEEDDEDEYTPSASRGDYGPSNPWDAPGMSIHDFI